MEAAWLICWTWDDEKDSVESPILSVQPLERTCEEIRRLVEALYGALRYGIAQQIGVATDPWAAPQLSRVERDESRGTRISCGSSPRIEAWEVRSLEVLDGGSPELVAWKEREGGRWVHRSMPLGEGRELIKYAG